MQKTIDGIVVNYRIGSSSEPSSDEDALDEVVIQKCYAPFQEVDVESGERWLDLGANIGAFAIYCRIKGAVAECYEPDLGNFDVLKSNLDTGFIAFPVAVSASKEKELIFYSSPNPLNTYRGTICTSVPDRYVISGTVANKYAGFLREQSFDGVKMDIEGAEGSLIDEWLLPKCNKLVFEYHTSRDSSVENLRRRLVILEKHFVNVHAPKEYREVVKSSEPIYKPEFDNLIFCWTPRG